MNKSLLLLTLFFTGLMVVESTSQAYWRDDYYDDYRREGVVGGAVDTSEDIVGGIFGGRRYHDDYCYRHPNRCYAR